MKLNPIETIRQHIDQIDQELIRLLNQRAQKALQTLEHKEKDSIYAPGREKMVLHNLVQHNHGPLSQRAIENIFTDIMHECRHLQYQSQKNNQQRTIAVQGLHASFSEGAAMQYCRDQNILSPQLQYHVSSESVIQSLNNHQASIGIMAINNDQGGLVEETIAALNQESYQVIDTVAFLVEQNLLTQANCDQNDIKTVYSHSQAIRQCQSFVDSKLSHCKIVEVGDTALAAKQLADGHYGKQAAVIASAKAAEAYHLIIYHPKIQNLENNITIFLVIQKREST